MRPTTSQPGGALRRPLAALIALGLLAGAGLAQAQTVDVAPQAPDRLWGGCQLNFSSLPLGTGSIPFDFLVLYNAANPNGGQPVHGGSSTDPIGYTGPVVCTAQGVSIQSFSEAVDLPNSAGKPPGSSVDVLPSVLGSAIRYQESVTLRHRFCHQILAENQCYTVEPGSGGDCTVPQSQYDTITSTLRARAIAAVQATRNMPGNVKAQVLNNLRRGNDSIDVSAIVAYQLGSTAPPRVCGTTGRRAVANGDGFTGTVLDAQTVFGLRYLINGGSRAGKTEGRPCHTVAGKTDCFRVFK